MPVLVKKTVDEWLNNIAYDHDPYYAPSDFALDFVNFIKMLHEGSNPLEHATPVIHYKMLDNIAGKKENIANMCSRGLAKALPLDDTVITDKGRVTIKDLQPGDSIFGEDGRLTKVIAKSRVFDKPMYEIRLADGRTQRVSEDHINVVIQKRKIRVNGKNTTEYQKRNLTTKELLNYAITTPRKRTLKNPKGREVNFWVPSGQAVKHSEKDFLIDPYTLGVILGDGSMDEFTGYVRIHGHKEDFNHYRTKIPYNMGSTYIDKRNTNVWTQGIKGIGKYIRKLKLNVHGDFKFIPKEYLYGSIQQRTALLQGLMDTDGTSYTNGGTVFTSNSLDLCKGVVSLVRSLGGIANNPVPMQNSYRVNIRANFSIFSLPRKKTREHTRSVTKVGILEIAPIEQVPSQCIAVANKSKTFLVNDYLVTHNTTLFAEYLYLYIAVYGDIPGFGLIDYALYVSDSIENGVKKMRLRLERHCDNSPFLKKYIKEYKFTDIRWYFKNIDGKEFVITGHGAQTGIRGTVELGTRPQLAILDDLVSDKDARSPTVIASIEDTVYSALDFALHPNKRKVIWSGTPFNAKDPLYKAIESGAWYVNVYPVCEKFPCSKEDFRSAWPARFTYEYVKNQYEKNKKVGKIDSFNQELMLRIMSEEERLITDSDIMWYSDSNNIIKNKGAYNYYITTDFATSDKESADFSVISVWAYNNIGQWFYVDGFCKKALMNETIDALFRLCSFWKPQEVGIEVTGQQGAFIAWIQKEQMERNIFFTLSKGKMGNSIGIRPTKDKMSRFQQNAVPLFKAKQIWLPENLKEDSRLIEMVNELQLATYKGFKSKHDDVIDTITMLPELNSWKPSELSVIEEEDDVNYFGGVWGDSFDSNDDNYAGSSYFV